jgi:hypothetical protein
LGSIWVIVCVAATILMFNINAGLGLLALALTIVNYLTLGLMRRGNATNFAVSINMFTTICAFILLVVGLMKGCS